jgi:hypothetical protein
MIVAYCLKFNETKIDILQSFLNKKENKIAKE